MSNKVIQSYVWHGDKCYFVSTINRECSARLSHGEMYAETIVWEHDAETQKRRKMLWQGEDITDGIETHIAICKSFHDHGKEITDCE